MKIFGQHAPLSDDMRQWIAENLLLGITADDLVRELAASGLSGDIAQREIAQAKAHPYMKAALQAAWRANKYESLLGIWEAMEAQLPGADAIARERYLSREDFHTRYYAANRPVIVEGAMVDWPAVAQWSPEYLKATYGDAMVTVQANREQNPDYQRAFEKYCQSMPLGEFIDRITEGGPSNDLYLAAKNNALQDTPLKGLLGDIRPPAAYFEADAAEQGSYLWFGPGGTITALHHDWVNAMIAQVTGHKRIRLVSSRQSHRVYNDTSRFSEVDCEHPDFDRHPLFAGARVMECVLAPGEMIFIPVGWWHDVRALDTSISVTMTKFVFPNVYAWNVPPHEYLQ